jgi:prepilin-type N-terminal cleavage/methylation domain-containing protein
MHTPSTKSSKLGFTIVELLIVIVIIAVLATIVIITYRSITDRAKFSAEQNDFTSIRAALELYKTDNNDNVPDSSTCVNSNNNYRFGWCGYAQGTNDSFIPGLYPKYMRLVPNLSSSLAQTNTYLYQSKNSNGTGAGTAQYELIRYKADGLNATETNNNANAMTGNGYDGLGWGFKSNAAYGWW